MSVRSEVLLWAQRVIARGGDAAPHLLLEIKENAGLAVAQEAFHKIARTAHPDLHRTTLSPEEFELVTTAYSRVAGAYQELRSPRPTVGKSKPAEDSAMARRIAASAIGSAAPGPAAPPPPAPEQPAASAAMNGKALIYYRKAELAIRRGDLKGALLQLKMAIAADPQSTLLRTAMSQVETELKK